MEKKQTELPIYDAFMIEGNEELGMEKISLVKDPANRKAFLSFSEHKEKAKFMFSEDRQLITCALMQPDDLIYRNQGGEEFYIKYSSFTIEKMIHKFMKEGRTGSINEEHETDVEGVYVVEMACVDESRGLSSPKGLELRNGSAWCTLKIENPKIWQSVKDKTFEGISLEGLFGMKQEFSKQETKESLKDSSLISCVNLILDPKSSYKAKYNALVNNIINKKK